MFNDVVNELALAKLLMATAIQRQLKFPGHILVKDTRLHCRGKRHPDRQKQNQVKISPLYSPPGSRTRYREPKIICSPCDRNDWMKYLTVFGLPTSNTEYCQILPNSIWELALKTTLTQAITQANNWYSRVQTIHHEIKSIYSSILNSFLLTYFTASLLMLSKTISTCATELATSFQHAGAIYTTVFTAQSCTQTKRNIMCYSECDLTC